MYGIVGSGCFHVQNAKFTNIAGYTSCTLSDIENIIKIFGKCVNVLNFNAEYKTKSYKQNRARDLG